MRNSRLQPRLRLRALLPSATAGGSEGDATVGADWETLPADTCAGGRNCERALAPRSTALQAEDLLRDTYCALADSRTPPAVVATEGSYSSSATSGGDVGVGRAAIAAKTSPGTNSESAEFPVSARMARRISPPPTRCASQTSVATRAPAPFWPGFRGVDNIGALTGAELSSPAAVAFEVLISPPRLLAVVGGMIRSVQIGKRCPRTPSPGGGIASDA